jgi:hypothetical protein
VRWGYSESCGDLGGERARAKLYIIQVAAYNCVSRFLVALDG